LANIHYEFRSTGRQELKIESKDKMKERGLRSPDIADALIISYADAGGDSWKEFYKKEMEERQREMLGLPKPGEPSEPTISIKTPQDMLRLKEKAKEIGI